MIHLETHRCYLWFAVVGLEKPSLQVLCINLARAEKTEAVPYQYSQVWERQSIRIMAAIHHLKSTLLPHPRWWEGGMIHLETHRCYLWFAVVGLEKPSLQVLCINLARAEKTEAVPYICVFLFT